MLARALPRQTIGELAATLAALPGVRSVGITRKLSLRGGGYNLPLAIEGRSDIAGMMEYRIVTPGYLASAGIPLRAGRTIAESDRRGGARVVVINEALVRNYFTGVNPIGRRVGGDVDKFAFVVGS